MSFWFFKFRKGLMKTSATRWRALKQNIWKMHGNFTIMFTNIVVAVFENARDGGARQLTRPLPWFLGTVAESRKCWRTRPDTSEGVIKEWHHQRLVVSSSDSLKLLTDSLTDSLTSDIQTYWRTEIPEQTCNRDIETRKDIPACRGMTVQTYKMHTYKRAQWET